jgi:hypothetical protein
MYLKRILQSQAQDRPIADLVQSPVSSDMLNCIFEYFVVFKPRLGSWYYLHLTPYAESPYKKSADN